MRSSDCIVAAGLSVLLLAGCARQPQPGPSGNTGGVSTPSEDNAAPTYHAVFVALGEPLLDAIKNDRADDASLIKHGPDLDRLEEATRSPVCDFGVDLSRGMETEMPHLPEIRALARALRADAARLVAAGDTDGAARRTAAILRLAVHLARQGNFTIDLLTASAIAGLGADFAAQNPALADAPWKTDIQNALDEVEKDGTLRAWAILQREGELSAQWIREGRAPDLSGAGGENWPAKSQTERDAAADKLQALIAESAAAWARPDAVTRLEAITARAAREDANDFYIQIARVRTSVDKLNISVAEAKAALQK